MQENDEPVLNELEVLFRERVAIGEDNSSTWD
jgi:hypothetical protein